MLRIQLNRVSRTLREIHMPLKARRHLCVMLIPLTAVPSLIRQPIDLFQQLVLLLLLINLSA